MRHHFDEQLDDTVCKKLEQHFDGCEPCKLFLASLESTIQQLRRVLRSPSTKEAAGRLRHELLSKIPLSFTS